MTTQPEPTASRFVPLGGPGRVQFTDLDGDSATIVPANAAAGGPVYAAVYIYTSELGAYVPLDAIDRLIAAIREAARVAADRANSSEESTR